MPTNPKPASNNFSNVMRPPDGKNGKLPPTHCHHGRVVRPDIVLRRKKKPNVKQRHERKERPYSPLRAAVRPEQFQQHSTADQVIEQRWQQRPRWKRQGGQR